MSVSARQFLPGTLITPTKVTYPTVIGGGKVDQ
jgi:hypothetical protein